MSLNKARKTPVPPSPRDDATLVARARAGNAAAFEELVRRYFRPAYAIALALLGDAMDAEDVCQDAFVKALERLEDCRKPDRFGSWFLQIVRNRAHNYRDYRRVRAGVSLDAAASASPDDSARVAEQSELRERLERALAQIGEVPRQVVLLHDLEGWKHRQIAEHLGLSEGMSRQHLFNARRALRGLLGAQVVKEHLHE